MTTLTMQFSNEPNDVFFTMGLTGCEECPKYAVGLFAPVDDEGLFAYCAEHMRSVSPLAASVLLGALDDEYSDLQLMLLDELGECPRCGGGLDTGAGFGQRDLECSDVCIGLASEVAEEDCSCRGDEDLHCGWSRSYPIELYRDKLMPKYLRGDAGPEQALVATIVQEKRI